MEEKMNLILKMIKVGERIGKAPLRSRFVSAETKRKFGKIGESAFFRRTTHKKPGGRK